MNDYDGDCHCGNEHAESFCADCDNPLGPFNFTGVCKACQRERDREFAEAAANALIRKLDDAGVWWKP